MDTLDLTGTWHVTWSESNRGLLDRGAGAQMDPNWYLPAEVPGEMHLDLMRNGLIDDPRQGLNILKARWVEQVIWCYRRHFEVPQEAAEQRSWLVLEQLDLAAKVYLNGELIGEHCNLYYPCRIETTGKLTPGENRLIVQVESGLIWAGNKDIAGLNPKTHDPINKRQWLRKPQFQFGWDWSGRMVNVGISGPVRLEWTDAPIRPGCFVAMSDLARDLETADVRGRFFAENLTDETVEARLTLSIRETGESMTVDVELEPGCGVCEAVLACQGPQLWWPVGHGDQKLYTVTAELSAGGRTIGQASRRVGFRRVRVIQDPHPESGRFFLLEINGRNIFCKGGNFVPADMIYSAVDRDRYATLIDRALEANFNFLRIWGGGLYEADDFYELCDAKGVLVWQEFAFACGKYPGFDETFHEETRREARHNIRRLAHHPSLVIWCGNNEMQWGSWAWGYEAGCVHPDLGIFHLTLPRILSEEDPTRFYWPSSPHSLDNVFPNADHTGDQHPWSLGFADTPDGMDFRKYRDMICRFANEGGFLGPNSLPTTLAALPEGQSEVGSLPWQVHDNTFFNDLCRHWIGRSKAEMTVEEHTYRAGLLHGEALREYCNNFQRRMFSSASAIFWMYNDTWPCSRSWTIVDYYLRRTPAFHNVRRAMAPVNIVLAEQDGQVIVYGINETDESIEATLRYGVFELAGDYPLDKTAQVVLPPVSSTPVARFDADTWPDKAAGMCFAVLTDRDGELIARNRLFDAWFKDMRWPTAEVKVRLEKGRAVFTCETFAWGVCLDLDGEEPLGDNFFDIYPGQAYAIDWPGDQPPRILHVGNLA